MAPSNEMIRLGQAAKQLLLGWSPYVQMVGFQMLRVSLAKQRIPDTSNELEEDPSFSNISVIQNIGQYVAFSVHQRNIGLRCCLGFSCLTFGSCETA